MSVEQENGHVDDGAVAHTRHYLLVGARVRSGVLHYHDVTRRRDLLHHVVARYGQAGVFFIGLDGFRRGTARCQRGGRAHVGAKKIDPDGGIADDRMYFLLSDIDDLVVTLRRLQDFGKVQQGLGMPVLLLQSARLSIVEL